MPTTATPIRKKMLLIDDDPKLLLGLKAVMTRKGYEVLSTTEGKEGIRLAKENQPNIIICDVMMPAPNGFQLKRLLSGDASTASIPFIFLTARTFVADKIAGLEQGADDYVTKPFNTDELVTRVEAIIRRDELGRQRGIREMEDALGKMRQSISVNFGHGLRTPLTVILASLDLAIREKFEGRTEDLDWYLKSSLASAQKLSMLVEDMILLSDIDQGNLGMLRIPINLDLHFNKPVHDVLFNYREKKLSFRVTIDDDLVIHASAGEFPRVVSHLVDNACKFSPDNAKVWVSLRRNGVGGCSLVVENEGSYIPLELREKVFERYFQIEQGNDRLHNGLGVGLTIARAVAEASGGNITILDSEVGCKVRMIYPPI